MSAPGWAAARTIERILAGGERAFIAGGYDLTTMDAVARQAGVARASVYNNFAGKEELFLAVMERGIDAFVAETTGRDDPARPALARLRAAAVGFLRAAATPDAVAMYRMVVALAPRFPQLGRTLHDRGLQRIEQEFATLAAQAGIVEAGTFAARLFAMLMGGYFGDRLLGIASGSDDVEAFVDTALTALV